MDVCQRALLISSRENKGPLIYSFGVIYDSGTSEV